MYYPYSSQVDTGACWTLLDSKPIDCKPVQFVSASEYEHCFQLSLIYRKQTKRSTYTLSTLESNTANTIYLQRRVNQRSLAEWEA